MESELEAPSRPVIEDGAPQSLHPAIKRVWQYSNLIGWTISAIVLSVIEYAIVNDGDVWAFRFPLIAPLVCLLLLVLSWRMAKRQYDAWTYALREHDLVLSHGVFWRSRRCVARGRVQHIDINSGPLDRRFGLVQVSIYAAGALGSVGSIPGLTPERAEALREAIFEGRDVDA